MGATATFVLAVVGITVITLAVLGVVGYMLYKLSQARGDETKGRQALERELIEKDNARPAKKERLKLEYMLQHEIEEMQKRHQDNLNFQKHAAEKYEERFHEHVVLNGQDPDTFDMPVEQRQMRKEIKELEIKLQQKQEQRKEARKLQEKQDKEERAQLAKSNLGGIRLDSYFEDEATLEEENDQRKPKRSQEYKVSGEDAARLSMPARSLRHKEEMASLYKEYKVLKNREKFQKLDIDNSGFLDKDEVRMKMEAAMGEPVPDEEVDRLFAAIDSDGNGLIDMQEFIDYMSSERIDQIHDWWGPVDDDEESDQMSSTSQSGVQKPYIPRFADKGKRGQSKRAPKPSPKNVYTVQAKHHPSEPLRSEAVRNYVLNKDNHDTRYK